MENFAGCFWMKEGSKQEIFVYDGNESLMTSKNRTQYLNKLTNKARSRTGGGQKTLSYLHYAILWHTLQFFFFSDNE